MGRPTVFSLEIADEICERLGEGEPMRQICRDERMPGWWTVYRWINADDEFAKRIAHARDLGFEAIAQEVLQIADTQVEGVRVEESKDGTKTVREDMLGHRKLQIETRLKLLAKWCPKRYGERVDHTHANPDGSALRLMIGSTTEARKGA